MVISKQNCIPKNQGLWKRNLIFTGASIRWLVSKSDLKSEKTYWRWLGLGAKTTNCSGIPEEDTKIGTGQVNRKSRIVTPYGIKYCVLKSAWPTWRHQAQYYDVCSSLVHENGPCSPHLAGFFRLSWERPTRAVRVTSAVSHWRLFNPPTDTRRLPLLITPDPRSNYPNLRHLLPMRECSTAESSCAASAVTGSISTLSTQYILCWTSLFG